jgi:ABC-type bacteriocin/lantibiotic exporter with double-glycine peptidase domain
VKLVVEALGRLQDAGHTAAIENSIKTLQRIELRDITFSYASSEKLVLEKASLTINAGEMIGLVGGSGAGKTTLVDILTGLLAPTSGSLLVDGKRLTARDMSSWLDLVGYVPQHVHLADTSVRENIAYSVSADAIIGDRIALSVEIANAESFIATLPGRFDALVGDRGTLLSGGQVQRIGIARAMYKQPKLLILDEATNALDEETEKIVLTNLLRRCRESGLAVLLVAHRKSTLSFCARLYEVNERSIRPVTDALGGETHRGVTN